MKKRFTEFLAHLKMGQNKFEEKVGLSRGFINKLADNITVKSLDKIKAAYPELNTEWLLYGKGDMINTPINQKIGRTGNVSGVVGVAYGDVSAGASDREKDLEAENAKLREENEALRESNQKLLDRVLKLTDRLLDKLN